MNGEPLTEREHLILEAVIRTYVETAEPAGSRTIARRYDLGISPATVRNTMSDLEDKGYLAHPHTSAGRIPTDLAYRFYVDSLLGQPRVAPTDRGSLERELQLVGDARSAVELLIGRAAQVLGILTQELGIAIAPRLHQATLDRLDLLAVEGGKVLLVMTLRAHGVRTVFVDVPAEIPAATLAAVAQVLNERLAGSTLGEIRRTLPNRLRDSAPAGDPLAAEFLNIFLQSADEWLEIPVGGSPGLHLGRASVLAEQPEFHSGERLRGLIELTERRDLLQSVLGKRLSQRGLQITIGAEHESSALTNFTVVTSEYHVGSLRGVIGVIGPTRMPYDRVISMVESASVLVSEMLT